VYFLPDSYTEPSLGVDMHQHSDSLHLSNSSKSRIHSPTLSVSKISELDLQTRLLPDVDYKPDDTISKLTGLDKNTQLELLEVSLFDLLELKKQKVSKLLLGLLQNDFVIRHMCFVLKVDRVQRRDRISYLLDNDMHFMSQFSTIDGERYVIKNEERFDLFFEIDMLDKKKIPKKKRTEALEKYNKLKCLSKILSPSKWDSFLRKLRELNQNINLKLWKFLAFHDNSNYFGINKLLVFLIVVGYPIMMNVYWEVRPIHKVLFFLDYLFLPFIDFFNIVLYFAFFFSNKIKIERIFIYSCFLTAIKGFFMSMLFLIGYDSNKLILFSIFEVFVNLVITYIQCFNYSYHYFIKYVYQIKQIQ
jgi:hypothetical protein